MDHRELESILSQDIAVLTNLRDKLSDAKESLSTVEKQIIRDQLSGSWLRSMHAEQKMFFVDGDAKGILNSSEYIIKVIEQFF